MFPVLDIELILELVKYAIYTASTLVIGILTKLYLSPEILPNTQKSEHESAFYKNSKKLEKERENFPSISETATIDLSVVIPAYNEEERLPVCLDEIFEFFEKNKSLKYEIIVVNDGSKDTTSDVVLKYTDKYTSDRIRLLEFEVNRGKGGAVRQGVLVARGEKVLFCDADGATTFEDVELLIKKLDSHKDDENKEFGSLVIGSRAHLENESVAERSLFRTILMKGFHVWVKVVGGVSKVHDTQCGFKLFTRTAAKFLFSNLHIERWAFDVELLYTSEKHNMKIGEVAVRWQEIDGSKLTPALAAIQMARDLLMFRLRFLTGVYKFRYEKR
jgi:dolichyl-phosphate beta-glucosyltransferase